MEDGVDEIQGHLVASCLGNNFPADHHHREPELVGLVVVAAASAHLRIHPQMRGARVKTMRPPVMREPVVVRAAVVEDTASAFGAPFLDRDHPDISWLQSEHSSLAPFLHCWIEEEMSNS